MKEQKGGMAMDDTAMIKLFQDRSQNAVSAASAILMTALSMKVKFQPIKIMFMYIDAKRTHFKGVYVFVQCLLTNTLKGYII